MFRHTAIAAILLLPTIAACTNGSAQQPASATSAQTTPPTSQRTSTSTSVNADAFAPPPLPSVGPPIAATVTRVHDGDSLDVLIGEEEDEVRLLGSNAPEIGECLGEAARSAMAEAVGGKEVVLFGSERDQFGRLLAFVEVDGSPVGWLAVRRGLALALSVDHPRLAAYAEAEDDAFIDGIGMWALDACGPPAAPIVGIGSIEWDPPGPDEDDLNGESVRLETEGEPAAIGGWVLRDESTRWRFEFPRGFMLVDDVTIYTGCGDDDADELHWCADGPIWNNSGDTAMLLDSHGNIVARITYGIKQDR